MGGKLKVKEFILNPYIGVGINKGLLANKWMSGKPEDIRVHWQGV